MDKSIHPGKESIFVYNMSHHFPKQKPRIYIVEVIEKVQIIETIPAFHI